jgi:hypothetical protein
MMTASAAPGRGDRATLAVTRTLPPGRRAGRSVNHSDPAIGCRELESGRLGPGRPSLSLVNPIANDSSDDHQ